MRPMLNMRLLWQQEQQEQSWLVLASTHVCYFFTLFITRRTRLMFGCNRWMLCCSECIRFVDSSKGHVNTGRYTDDHEYPDPVRGKQAFRLVMGAVWWLWSNSYVDQHCCRCSGTWTLPTFSPEEKVPGSLVVSVLRSLVLLVTGTCFTMFYYFFFFFSLLLLLLFCILMHSALNQLTSIVRKHKLFVEQV